MEQDEQVIRIGNYTSQFGGRDLLGSGGFGVVYVGHQINNRKNKVAIKLISLQQSSQNQIMKQALQMLNLRSQGTLQILASDKIKFGAKQQQYYAIVTEKMDGSLRDLLKEKEKLTEAQVIEWGRKIIKCHAQGPQTENVLYRKFGEQIIFKIADFGLSRNLNSSNLSNKGTSFYVSPQQEEKQGKYTDKTDVYAFGCIMFELLIGPKKLFSKVSNQSINKKEAVKIARKALSDIGVSEIMIRLIKGCLMYEESDRLAWKDVFDHKIFKEAIEVDPNRIGVLVYEREIFPEKNKLEIKDKKMKESKINKLRITPGTTTQAWKEKSYRQDTANKNFCISNGGRQWLCSSDLCDGECVFTIKVHKVQTYDYFGDGILHSFIMVGLMDSNYKEKNLKEDTKNNCVYLYITFQQIRRPNHKQTEQEWINCSCQPFLESVPCLIKCHVNRNQNTIAQHYNGKHQANSTIPNSWKDGRKLCAVVMIMHQGDTVEFM